MVLRCRTPVPTTATATWTHLEQTDPERNMPKMSLKGSPKTISMIHIHSTERGWTTPHRTLTRLTSDSIVL